MTKRNSHILNNPKYNIYADYFKFFISMSDLCFKLWTHLLNHLISSTGYSVDKPNLEV